MEKEMYKYRSTVTKKWVVTTMEPAADADPNTICMYSGTNDIEGKPIFEGDVLKDGEEHGKLWTIQRRNGSFYAVGDTFADTNEEVILPRKTLVDTRSVTALNLKIIGNVFDK